MNRRVEWRRARRALPLLAAALIAPTVARAASEANLGFVLEASGKWQIASGGAAARALVVGESVKAGDKLLPGAPDAKLTVVMLDGTRLSCPSDARCAAPLGGKPADKPGIARRVLKAIGGLFSQPERYAATMSRGEELRESVALIKKERLDLSDALAALPKGPVHVTLQPIDTKGQVVLGESYGFDFDTSKAAPDGLPAAKGLKPGLYRASLESGADAWVLVSVIGNVKEARAQWAEVQKLAAELGREGSVSGRAVKSFLRAALDAMAHGNLK